MVDAIKTVSAIIMLVAFFLPLSQCHLVERIEVKTIEGSKIIIENDESASEPKEIVIKASESFEIDSLDSWVVLLAFLWPTVLTVFYVVSKKRMTHIVRIVEPLFCILTAYFIGQALLLGEILYGGYIWAGAISIYFVAAIVDSIKSFRYLRSQ